MDDYIQRYGDIAVVLFIMLFAMSTVDKHFYRDGQKSLRIPYQFK